MGGVKPRLRHVAEIAGVSQATVSRVLNDRPGVAPATRREVLAALHQLGYEPVGVASVRTRARGLVGLIVPELDNPAFPRLAQALESRLAAQGLTTMLCTSTPSGMREGDYLDVLLEHAVTGIVIVSGEGADTTADHGRYRDLIARRVPTILVNGHPDDIDLPAVSVDHISAGKQVVRHLASLGHQRIGLAIGPTRYLPTLGLLAGYREGLAAAGLPADDTLVSETFYGIEGGHAAAARLLEQAVTAIVCASDRMALGSMRAVREHGLRVPADVSITGFDDAGPNAYVHPPLTSVRQPFESMAAAVLRMLTAAIEDPDTPPSELRFQPELIVRGSTAPAPHLRVALLPPDADAPDTPGPVPDAATLPGTAPATT